MIARTLAAAVTFAVCASPPQATAQTEHGRKTRATYLPPPSHHIPARDPSTFYPNEIEGGVRGNLSFNNQLRKFLDPLNANGGGG